jgi:Putative adhesin
MREHTFDLPADARMTVSLAAGEIEIETQPGREAFVRLSPLDDQEVSREAVEDATVELHGTELLVKVKEKRFSFGSGPQVRAEIRCPEGIPTALHTASGDIRVRGRLGHAKTHVASGDVQLDHVDGRLEAHSASGDVLANRVGADAEVHSASGDIELRRTESGVSVRSASGDVSLDDVGGGPIKVHSASGDVRVAVRPGRRVEVDVRTVSGEAHSDIPLDGSGEGDDDAPLVEIKVNGVSGDVHIGRAAERVELEA